MGRRAEGWKLRPDKRTAIFFVRFTFAGHRYNRTTGERDPKEAEGAAARIYTEVVSGDSARSTVSRSWAPVDEVAALWIADLESSRDPLTTAQYQNYVRAHWTPFFRTVGAISESSIENYWRERLRVVQRNTVKKELSALRGFLRWCKLHGFIATVPHVQNPPTTATGQRNKARNPKSRPVPLDEAEVERVIAQLPEWFSAPRCPKRYPVRARFELAWELGLRPATLSELRAPDDYAPGRDTLIIRDEVDKARFGRELPLTARAQEALDRVCPDSGLIFGKHDFRDRVRRAAEAAGLPPEKVERISAYDFRHARLTHLAEVSSNLPGIAFLAGHRHLTTTARYMRPHRRAAERVLAAAVRADLRGSEDDSSDL